jgi:peroxiredoxin
MHPVQLSSFAGKPILLSFWVSSTEISRANIRSLNTFYNEFSSSVQFVVVNIADGKRDSIPTAAAFLMKESITFPVFFVTQSINYKYSTVPMTIPMTLLIDKNGFIVHRFYDVVSHGDLIRQLSALN